MKYFAFIISAVLVMLFSTKANGQSISNEGTDFWAVFPTHVPTNTNTLGKMSIFITSRLASSGKVIAGGNTYDFVVAANGVTEVAVDRAGVYIDDIYRVLVGRGVHILVDAGKPKVAAYCHIYADKRSEAYLILPTEAMGQTYFSMNTSGSGSGQNYIVVCAIEPDTRIKINVGGIVRNINLVNPGDVYEILSFDDLSGTKIEIDEATGCKKFAAYSGHSAVQFENNGQDPLCQQLYPIDSWGKNYGVIPFSGQNYFYKVVAMRNNTVVTENGAIIATLNEGQSYTSGKLSGAVQIAANNLISVAEFAYSQGINANGSDREGDPDMVLLNPTEYGLKRITLFSSDREFIRSKYLNVYIKTSAISSFKINGFAPPIDNFKPMPSDPTYSYLQIQVDDLAITLSASDSFNAIAYGFGQNESYAYSAGTNLAANQYLTVVNRQNNTENQEACVNIPTDFKITFPYLLNKIVLKFSDGSPDFVQNNPTYTTTANSNGENIYSYFLPINKTFTTPGTNVVTATITFQNSTNVCFSGTSDAVFDVEVNPTPLATFDLISEGCANTEIQLKDNSTSNITDKPITKWFWDFGDGQTSTEQNPVHNYLTNVGRNYTVKLMVGTEVGCMSDVATHDIYINPAPSISMQVVNTTCVRNQVIFTISPSPNVIKKSIAYGDGASEIITPNTIIHRYGAAGNYTAMVIVETDKGCKDTVQAQINVLPEVKAVFLLPASCVSDDVIFINQSLDYDATESNLTYLWDFGDPASGVRNTSTLKNGTHRFTAAAIYNIKLTVFSNSGCKTEVSQSFTVNGGNPVAAFELINSAGVCTNKGIQIRNKSNISFGKITKLKWDIDGVSYVTENPVEGDIYTFPYLPFYFPTAEKSININLTASSGETCNNIAPTQIVKLFATPNIVFDRLFPVCVNEKPFQLLGREISGLGGTTTYSGSGVSTTGVFDASLAKAGSHTITYTFTSENGCSESITREIIVYSVPKADAGSDKFVLEGGQIQLAGSTSDSKGIIKWIPNVGLDRDDILSPIATPLKDTKYTLQITNDNGCIVTDEVLVTVLTNIDVPNSFTPNGDGVNDLWNIKYLDSYPNATIDIFTRGGERIFNSKGYANPFDGTFNGKPLPVGVYYYLISPNNGRKRTVGNLTLIR